MAGAARTTSTLDASYILIIFPCFCSGSPKKIRTPK